ncbi:RHS repeat-associated core domain-containing protein, partial [Xylanibacter ruminicola]
LQADKSRGIAYITYDLNNNPQQIYFMNGSVTKYVYSASGQKLRAVHYTAKPNISRTWGVKPAELTSSQILQADSTDYLLGGSLTMKNGRIDKYIFDGGYAQASVASSTSDNFTFYYYTPDHLGNIREVVNASGSVQQVTNYYPFGAPYAESTAADFQPYKYNGKELDKMHGLNTYDYGARQHDPILARWDRMDPLCEKFYNVSPYVYCVDNPICAIDIKGLYPKGILNHHKTTFYRADYYTFTKPAAHLLSLVTGVKEDYIRDVNVIEKGIGREYPSYNPNNGGGGITIGSSPYNVTMTFTNNFFADNASDYNGNGYGQNITEWLSLVSHEATHIKHIEQAGNKISYLVHFLKQYVKYGDHDNVPEEKEADSKRNKYRKFSKFINDNYGENSIQNLFNSELSDGQKIRQIDDWWKEWQTYGK